MELRRAEFSDLGIDLLAGNSFVDFEHADEMVLLGDDADEMQRLVNKLSSNLFVCVACYSSQSNVR